MSTIAIALKLALGAIGAVVGCGIGYLADVAISKCRSESAVKAT